MVNNDRRRAIQTVGTTGIISLAGCLGGFTGGNGDGSGSSDAVEWWNLWVAGSQQDTSVEIVSQFEEETGITVNQTKYENTPYKSAITNALGTSNAPDLFYIWAGPNRLGRYVENGNVISLEDHFTEEEINPHLTEAVRGTRYEPGEILSWRSTDGDQFASPFTVTPIPVYYNKTVLEDAGVDPSTLQHSTDVTWEEFLDICQTIADAGYQPLVIGNSNRWPLGHTISAFMMKAAGVEGYLNAAYGINNRSLTEDPFVEALSRVQALYEEGYINQSVNSINDNEAAAQIFNDEVAFYHSPSIQEVIETQTPEDFGGIPDQMDYMWWPYFPDLYQNGNNERVSVVPGTTFAVSSEAEQRGEEKLQNTLEFLKYLSSSEIQQYWLEQTNELITNTGVYENFEAGEPLNTLTSTIDDIEAADAVGSVFDVAFLPDTSEALLSGGQDLFTGSSAEEVLQNAQQTNERALSDLQ